jgi:hypothetical protein
LGVVRLHRRVLLLGWATLGLRTGRAVHRSQHKAGEACDSNHETVEGIPLFADESRFPSQPSSSFMKKPTKISVWSAGLFVLLLSAPVAQAWHVSGKIVCDVNGNGAIDAGDTPVQGVIVAVEAVNGPFTGAAATDASGFFRLDLPHSSDSYHAYPHPTSVPPGAMLIAPPGGVHTFALTDANQAFEQANFVFDCAPTPPPPGSADCGKVTGGGWIDGTPSGAKANFGVSGGPGNWGHLNYIDHGTGMHVRSTGVTAYEEVAGDDDARVIRYNVVIDSVAGTAVVRVADRGEPGTRDRFEITLSNGYTAGGELGGPRPGGGNIQLHQCPPGKKK